MPQIKNWITGETILEYEGELSAAVVKAVQDRKLLTHADLRGADLRGACLRGADLQGAYLRGADLQGADLQGADLRGADLQGADLQGADLRGAYLRGADLQGADLQGADLRGQPIVSGGTRSDGYGFLLTNFPEQGVRILAGCRNFNADEARTHWTAKGGQLGAESLAILDHLLRLAEIRGLVPAANQLETAIAEAD